MPLFTQWRDVKHGMLCCMAVVVMATVLALMGEWVPSPSRAADAAAELETEGAVRLVGFAHDLTSFEGVVTVFHDGVWGTLRGAFVALSMAINPQSAENLAQVVCRQAGCESATGFSHADAVSSKWQNDGTMVRTQREHQLWDTVASATPQWGALIVCDGDEASLGECDITWSTPGDGSIVWTIDNKAAAVVACSQCHGGMTFAAHIVWVVLFVLAAVATIVLAVLASRYMAVLVAALPAADRTMQTRSVRVAVEAFAAVVDKLMPVALDTKDAKIFGTTARRVRKEAAGVAARAAEAGALARPPQLGHAATTAAAAASGGDSDDIYDGSDAIPAAATGARTPLPQDAHLLGVPRRTAMGSVGWLVLILIAPVATAALTYGLARTALPTTYVHIGLFLVALVVIGLTQVARLGDLAERNNAHGHAYAEPYAVRAGAAVLLALVALQVWGAVYSFRDAQVSVQGPSLDAVAGLSSYTVSTDECQACEGGFDATRECFPGAPPVSYAPVDMCQRCPLPGHCGGGVAHNCIGDGVDPASHLCGKCLDGWYPLLQRCRECSSAGNPIFSGVGAVVALVVICLVMAGGLSPTTEQLLKQAATFLQLMYINVTVRVQWPDWAGELWGYLQGVLLDVGAWSPECLWGGSWYATFWFVIFGVALVIGALVGVRQRVAARRRDERRDALDANDLNLELREARLAVIIVNAMLLAYMPLLRTFLLALDCTGSPQWPNPWSGHLVRDVDVSCEPGGGGYGWFVFHAVVAMAGTVALVVVVPAALFKYLWDLRADRERDLDADDAARLLRPLHAGLTEDFIYFEAVMLVYRALCVATSVLVGSATTQAVLLMVMSGVMLTFAALRRPWRTVPLLGRADGINELWVLSFAAQCGGAACALAVSVLPTAAGAMGGVLSAIGGAVSVAQLLAGGLAGTRTALATLDIDRSSRVEWNGAEAQGRRFRTQLHTRRSAIETRLADMPGRERAATEAMKPGVAGAAERAIADLQAQLAHINAELAPISPADEARARTATAAAVDATVAVAGDPCHGPGDHVLRLAFASPRLAHPGFSSVKDATAAAVTHVVRASEGRPAGAADAGADADADGGGGGGGAVHAGTAVGAAHAAASHADPEGGGVVAPLERARQLIEEASAHLWRPETDGAHDGAQERDSGSLASRCWGRCRGRGNGSDGVGGGGGGAASSDDVSGTGSGSSGADGSKDSSPARTVALGDVELGGLDAAVAAAAARDRMCLFRRCTSAGRIPVESARGAADGIARASAAQLRNEMWAPLRVCAVVVELACVLQGEGALNKVFENTAEATRLLGPGDTRDEARGRALRRLVDEALTATRARAEVSEAHLRSIGHHIAADVVAEAVEASLRPRPPPAAPGAEVDGDTRRGLGERFVAAVQRAWRR